MIAVKSKRTKVTTTLSYRMKDASELNRLDKLARAVNFVWNYCNEFDFQALTARAGKELGMSSVSVQAICKEYVTRRIRKLRWRTSRGSKRSIPFKSNALQVKGDQITYLGHKIWLSRPIDDKVLSGSFSQDAQGHVNRACEVLKIDHKHQVEEVGIDLGLKTSAVLSDGTIIDE